jgi:hypothetical protein
MLSDDSVLSSLTLISSHQTASLGMRVYSCGRIHMCPFLPYTFTHSQDSLRQQCPSCVSQNLAEKTEVVGGCFDVIMAAVQQRHTLSCTPHSSPTFRQRRNALGPPTVCKKKLWKADMVDDAKSLGGQGGAEVVIQAAAVLDQVLLNRYTSSLGILCHNGTDTMGFPCCALLLSSSEVGEGADPSIQALGNGPSAGDQCVMHGCAR